MIATTETSRPRPGSLVRKNFSFRNRGLLGAVILGPIAFASAFSAPQIPESELLAWLLNAGAWVFFLLYAGIRIWATLFIGGNKDLRLQTDGPYSVCRNPLYVGSFCFAVCLTCLLKSATFASGVILAFVVYLSLVVRAEEHFLELRFGDDFRNYCKRTPRFWPRWSSLSSPLHLQVDMKRLKQECVRLSRGAAAVLLLQILVHWRASATWPHWFSVP